MMIDRKDKRYVSCPVCGRILMKCQGQCNIDITCGKCNREIVVLVDVVYSTSGEIESAHESC